MKEVINQVSGYLMSYLKALHFSKPKLCLGDKIFLTTTLNEHYTAWYSPSDLKIYLKPGGNEEFIDTGYMGAKTQFDAFVFVYHKFGIQEDE